MMFTPMSMVSWSGILVKRDCMVRIASKKRVINISLAKSIEILIVCSLMATGLRIGNGILAK